MNEWRWEPFLSRVFILPWAWLSAIGGAWWSMQPLRSFLQNPPIELTDAGTVVRDSSLQLPTLSSLLVVTLVCAALGIAGALLILRALSGSRRLALITVIGGGLVALAFTVLSAGIGRILDGPMGSRMIEVVGSVLIIIAPLISGWVTVVARTRGRIDPFGAGPLV